MRINKRKNSVYIILLITVYIFVYFLKTDKNVYANQKQNKDAHRTYNELLIGKSTTHFHSKIKNPVPVKALKHYEKCADKKSVWQYASFYNNLCVIVSLKEKSNTTNQSTNIISARYKKNIHHKSSEDDIAVS
jgi:hypothetical protein